MVFINRAELDDAIKATKKKGRARRRHDQDVMNGLEKQYAAHLDILKHAREVDDWKFHAIKLRLAKATFYDIDFMVIYSDGRIEFAEVKGFWEDDARVKIKVAAELHQWATFAAYQWKNKQWVREAWNDDST